MTRAAPANPEAIPAARPTMRRDIASAYLVSAARVVVWAVVSALVYRRGGAAEFGTLALVRGTVGILNYTALGMAPAMVRLLAESRAPAPAADPPPLGGERTVYSTGVALALISFLAGLLLTALYAVLFRRLHVVPASVARSVPAVVVLIGAGTLLRLFSDADGAVLQTRGRIALDNLLLAGTEVIWIPAMLLSVGLGSWLLACSAGFALAEAALVLTRRMAVARLQATPWPPTRGAVDMGVLRRLLAFGLFVLAAQLADYLYAPTDYILINHFIGPAGVTAYAPAMQLDAGLFSVVGALGAVLLPKAALAHAAGAPARVRQYYLRGTLAGAALLALACAAVWLAAPFILRVWLGPHPPPTLEILPLVLLHTVIGGSSIVGRSILLAMGKVRAFTLAALSSGALNVIASYCFVRYTGWGLRGIVLGTIVAVTARCVLWMPWYVLHALRREAQGLAK